MSASEFQGTHATCSGRCRGLTADLGRRLWMGCSGPLPAECKLRKPNLIQYFGAQREREWEGRFPRSSPARRLWTWFQFSIVPSLPSTYQPIYVSRIYNPSVHGHISARRQSTLTVCLCHKTKRKKWEAWGKFSGRPLSRPPRTSICRPWRATPSRLRGNRVMAAF